MSTAEEFKKALDEFLAKHKRVIIPYLDVTVNGIYPKARFIEVKEKEDDNQGDTT